MWVENVGRGTMLRQFPQNAKCFSLIFITTGHLGLSIPAFRLVQHQEQDSESQVGKSQSLNDRMWILLTEPQGASARTYLVGQNMGLFKARNAESGSRRMDRPFWEMSNIGNPGIIPRKYYDLQLRLLLPAWKLNSSLSLIGKDVIIYLLTSCSCFHQPSRLAWIKR